MERRDSTRGTRGPGGGRRRPQVTIARCEVSHQLSPTRHKRTESKREYVLGTWVEHQNGETQDKKSPGPLKRTHGLSTKTERHRTKRVQVLCRGPNPGPREGWREGPQLVKVDESSIYRGIKKMCTKVYRKFSKFYPNLLLSFFFWNLYCKQVKFQK